MSKSGSKQVVGGATFSYILIILNTLYGLILTPFIISTLGEVEYGVYKTIAALSSALMVLDLGLGGTVTRYVAKYKAQKEDNEIPNFMAIIFLEASIIIIAIAIICFGLYTQLSNIYQKTFDISQLELAHKLFLITSFNMCLTIIENVVNGVITGCNELIFGNGIKIIRLVSRIVLTVIILQYIPSAITLVSINVGLTILFLFIECYWAFHKLGIKVKYSHWDKRLFSESFKYTTLLFISSIINQVNSNLDNVVVGAVIGASAVTIYSIGLTLYGMFEQLSTAISGVMLPTVMNTLSERDGMKKTRRLVVQAGRVQFAMLGAAFAGFIVLGRDFLTLWLGHSFMDAYYITIILMAPSIFSLTVNVCISILRAQNLLGIRTLIIFGTTLVNALITIIGTPRYGYYAAAIGTAFSLLLGVDIITNIYYTKKFSYNMLIVYKDIFNRIIVAILVPTVVTFFTHKYLNGSWTMLILNILIYICVYGVCLLVFGFNTQEKTYIKQLFGKVIK